MKYKLWYWVQNDGAGEPFPSFEASENEAREGELNSFDRWSESSVAFLEVESDSQPFFLRNRWDGEKLVVDRVPLEPIVEAIAR